MEIIPAIDLMNGKIVRLTRGEPETLKVYKHLGDAVKVARKWMIEGADALHIIDLDAALDRGNNIEVIKRIVSAVKMPIQVGGGIRSYSSAEALLNYGVERISLGSLAFENTPVLSELLEVFGDDRIIVALDHHNNEIMIRGWKASTKISVEEAVTKFLNLGVKFFLMTSITRDGTLTGLDYGTLSKACAYPGASVFAAGGVGRLEDLARLKNIKVRGVVIGKALYEGIFDLSDALKIAREK